jgi:hypothetical protein
MGHLLISCGSYHNELRSTTFYEPPHNIRHRQARSVAGVCRPVVTTTAPLGGRVTK